MGTDTTYTEWHLTLRGWIQGNWGVHYPPETSHTPPEDRIETWLEKETTHDVYSSKPLREWKRIWESPDHTEYERKDLRAKIRTPPVEECANSRRVFWEFPP